MTRHRITIEDCKLLPFLHDIASSYGKGSAKRLVVIVDVNRGSLTYRVTDHGETKYEGPWVSEAVSVYNEAP